MKTVQSLHTAGLLTDQQLLAAFRYSRNPIAFHLAPSLHRVLHDLIVREMSVTEVEKARGWPARSAKAILGVILNSIVEIGASDTPHPEPVREILDFVTGQDEEDVIELQHEFGFTHKEAQIFLILRNANTRVCSLDYLMRALYGDGGPDSRIIKVHVSRMRKKIAGSGFEIVTARGAGLSLAKATADQPKRAGSARALPVVMAGLQNKLPAYALHVELGYSMREAASLLGLRAGSSVLRAVRAVEEARDTPEVDAAVGQAVDALVRRWRSNPTLTIHTHRAA